MKLIVSPYNHAAYNLAMEEFLLKKSSEEFVLLYRNNPAIIVGKHQNSMAEVNYNAVVENNIPVIRRISGGGTVYHDSGNINFSFILNVPGQNKVDFRKYTRPIINFLRSLNLSVEFGKRNEILLNGKKISGNAEHVHKNRVLHHGTLLFDSKLDELTNILKVDLFSYRDKSCKSVRSVVGNITDVIRDVSVNDFMEMIITHLKQELGAQDFNLSSEIEIGIENLVLDKYSLFDWSFGYNPPYEFEKNHVLNKGNLFISLHVDKGQIVFSYIEISGKDEVLKALSTIDFSGINHEFYSVLHRLKMHEKFHGMDEAVLRSYVKLLF